MKGDRGSNGTDGIPGMRGPPGKEVRFNGYRFGNVFATNIHLPANEVVS